MPVIRKQGGPYSLFCTDCGTWTPNTSAAPQEAACHSHVCGCCSPNEIHDSQWKNTGKNYQIFRAVQHQYHIEDAKRHFDDYLEANELTEADLPINVDFDYLATAFEDNHDCNVADNDIWDSVIQQYLQLLPALTKEYTVSFSVTGRYTAHIPAVTADSALANAEIAVQEADFGDLDNVEWTIHPSTLTLEGPVDLGKA